MSEARFIVGHTLTALRAMPDASVDLVLTSPPFLGLRSYLPEDHPDKALEMGGEGTPGEFIDGLLAVTEECRRVLAPHGSLCVELGDTYSGTGGNTDNREATGAGYDLVPRPSWNGRRERNRTRDSRPGRESTSTAWTPRPEQGGGVGWPLDKSLCLIPELYRVALVYGFNPLTGRQTERWRARNVVRWCRPNPPVGALADKFRPGTSDMVVACMSRSRYFDLDAVRTEHQYPDRVNDVVNVRGTTKGSLMQERSTITNRGNPAGAPPLDWWEISTQPYPGSHYATFPERLCIRPIAAMCPERVCTTCGEPSRRITEPTEWNHREHPLERTGIQRGGLGTHGDRVASPTTTGWSDCGHDAWRPGVVLDPFAGSGTVLAVAFGHGRDSIGIDLDARNVDLARQRVGMWLTVEGVTYQ